SPHKIKGVRLNGLTPTLFISNPISNLHLKFSGKNVEVVFLRSGRLGASCQASSPLIRSPYPGRQARPHRFPISKPKPDDRSPVPLGQHYLCGNFFELFQEKAI